MAHRRGPSTERIILRAFEASDAEALFRLNSHPDVMRFTGEPPMTSVDAAREGIERYPDWERYGYGRWACVLRSEGEDAAPIGFCGLKFLEDHDEVDVGYRFLPQYWGRGLATEVATASIEFGFSTLGLTEIVAYVLPDNQGSIRVLSKLAMTRHSDVVEDGMAVQRWTVGPQAWAVRRSQG
jgi:RimJ/RimL family protein N-acetyltransferase